MERGRAQYVRPAPISFVGSMSLLAARYLTCGILGGKLSQTFLTTFLNTFF